LEKAEIGDTAGDTIATFMDVLHLTPRGRFDIDMYDTSFRLRGKTYDYKIPYDHIKKFMILPKPDDLHVMLCLGLDPPLRQGQTRYPFVIMQYKKDEEVTIDLNLTDEDLSEKYKGSLQPHYEQPVHQVVSYLFRGLAGKSLLSPAEEFQTHRQQYGIKCSIKASEGFLYCLKKSFMFVPKPATYISYEQTQSITFSRVGGAVSALSTFDITVHMKGGTTTQFSNINREDLKALENFFKLKGLRVKNEIDEDANLMAAALRDEMADDSEEEVVGAKADRGSADEDESSVDEDFQADSESDVAEEYDSDHESSGSGSAESDVDNEDAGEEDDDDDEEEEKPAKKKKKTG
jgi:structure-specific recognition protein 1